MRRREFISIIGGAAAWPLPAPAQQPAMPVVAFLNVGPPDARRDRVVAFLKGLSETGYVEGRNVAVEYYWLDANYKNLPAVLDLVIRRDVAVIAVPGATPASLERRFWAGTFLPTPMPRRSTRGKRPKSPEV